MRLVLSFILAASVALVAASDGKCTPAAEAQVQTAFKSAKDSCSGALTTGECSAECKDSLESSIMVEDNFLRCVRESSVFSPGFPSVRALPSTYCRRCAARPTAELVHEGKLESDVISEEVFAFIKQGPKLIGGEQAADDAWPPYGLPAHC